MYKQFVRPKSFLKTMLIIFALWLVSGVLDATFSSDIASSYYSDDGGYDSQYEAMPEEESLEKDS